MRGKELIRIVEENSEASHSTPCSEPESESCEEESMTNEMAEDEELALAELEEA